MAKNKIWTEAERAHCKELFLAEVSVDDIATRLNKLKRSVIDTLRKAGCRVSVIYSQEHDDFLRAHYQYAPWEYLEEHLPFSHAQIVRRSNILGLFRESSRVGKGSCAGMTCREEYGLTRKEWKGPPKKVPAPQNQSHTVHPALMGLL